MRLVHVRRLGKLGQHLSRQVLDHVLGPHDAQFEPTEIVHKLLLPAGDARGNARGPERGELGVVQERSDLLSKDDLVRGLCVC